MTDDRKSHIFIVGPAESELTHEKILSVQGLVDSDPTRLYFWKFHEPGRVLVDWPFDRAYEFDVVVEDAHGIRVIRYTREEEKAGQLNRLRFGISHAGGRVLRIF